MAIAKVILNGEVQMDVTSDTVEANKLLSGETATKNDGTKVTGTFVAPDPVISSLSVTPTESEQVFSGAETNILESFTMSSYDTTNRTITADVDFSYLEYGATYHVEGKIAYYPGSGQNGKLVTIDTDWVASENGEIPFTSDEGEKVSKVTLSKTQIIVYFSVSISSRWRIYYNSSDRRAFVFTRSIDGYKPVTVGAIASDYVGSAVSRRSNADMYKSEYAVYAPAGYYSSEALYTILADEHTAPTINFDSNYGTIRAIHNASDTIRNKHILSGTSNMFSDRQLPSLGASTYIPTESTQYISSYQWLTGSQTIAAISSTYIGSAIPLKSSADLTTNGSTVFVSSGYYSSDARTNVAAVTSLPSVSFSFTSVTDEGYATYTMSYSFTTSGFVSTGTHSEITGSWPYYKARTIIPKPDYGYVVIGNAVSIAAFEEGAGGITVGAIPSSYLIPSGTLSITSNGTYDVGAYASAEVSVAGVDSIYSSIYWRKTLTNEQIISHLALSSTIPNYAFAGRGIETFSVLSGLENVKSIGSYAFYYCSRLTTASFPQVSYIGSYAFYSCNNLTAASFPQVSSIGSYAFYDCYSLTAASFPSATSIGSSAFYGCNNLATVSFPQVSYIGAYAFYYCSRLTTADFPSAKTIGASAFYDCYSLTAASFPQVSYIGAYAFYGCNNLATVSFPQVSYIGAYAFYYCSRLTTADFPSAKTIGAYAFYSWSRLTTASFPQVSSIGSYAFYGCNNLTAASFPSATYIGSYAFYRCNHLATVSFPSATSIGDYTFYSCNNLTAASFPQVSSIGSYAFYYCSRLTTVSFPSATSIGDYTFYSCNNLATVSFPSATYIGAYAFYSCYSLTAASFPSATSIGEYAFYYCSRLTTADFPQVSYIGTYAFYSCYRLTTASFPSATYIGSYAFAYPYRYEGVTGVHVGLFLSSVFFPNCIEIRNYVFQNRDELATISFPAASVIYGSAFYANYGLMSAYFLGSSVPTLSRSEAFASTPLQYSSYTGSFGSIFVRASLADSFKTATNWSYYSDRIVGLTDDQIAAL